MYVRGCFSLLKRKNIIKKKSTYLQAFCHKECTRMYIEPEKQCYNSSLSIIFNQIIFNGVSHQKSIQPLDPAYPLLKQCFKRESKRNPTSGAFREQKIYLHIDQSSNTSPKIIFFFLWSSLGSICMQSFDASIPAAYRFVLQVVFKWLLIRYQQLLTKNSSSRIIADLRYHAFLR